MLERYLKDILKGAILFLDCEAYYQELTFIIGIFAPPCSDGDRKWIWTMHVYVLSKWNCFKAQWPTSKHIWRTHTSLRWLYLRPFNTKQRQMRVKSSIKVFLISYIFHFSHQLANYSIFAVASINYLSLPLSLSFSLSLSLSLSIYIYIYIYNIIYIDSNRNLNTTIQLFWIPYLKT